VEISAVLAEFSKVRAELGAKLDTINERLASFVLKSDHEAVRRDLEERLRRLENFKAWAIGAMAAAGVFGTILGTMIGWLVKR
jgi:hypothetical protein